MKRKEFDASLREGAFPEGGSALQQCLWHAARGNWEAAHSIVQEHEGEKDFDRMHAYLHRVEGDEWNANYWYRRAGESLPLCSSQEELEMLVSRWI